MRIGVGCLQLVPNGLAAIAGADLKVQNSI